MISGLLMHPRLESGVGPQQVEFTLAPYDKAEGPLRSMQKFTCILLTTQGTDTLRPWLGTQMAQVCHMNIVDLKETRVFIREQVTNAITQFFKLQAEEYKQNAQTADDVIKSIELTDITINEMNQISVTIKFTSEKYSSVIYSLKLKDN